MSLEFKLNTYVLHMYVSEMDSAKQKISKKLTIFEVFHTF